MSNWPQEPGPHTSDDEVRRRVAGAADRVLSPEITAADLAECPDWIVTELVDSQYFLQLVHADLPLAFTERVARCVKGNFRRGVLISCLFGDRPYRGQDEDAEAVRDRWLRWLPGLTDHGLSRALRPSRHSQQIRPWQTSLLSALVDSPIPALRARAAGAGSLVDGPVHLVAELGLSAELLAGDPDAGVRVALCRNYGLQCLRESQAKVFTDLSCDASPRVRTAARRNGLTVSDADIAISISRGAKVPVADAVIAEAVERHLRIGDPLLDESPSVRAATVRTGYFMPLDSWVAAARDPSPLVRAAAARYGNCRLADAPEAFVAFLWDDAASVRAAAATAWWAPAALKERFLNDPKTSVRRAMARSANTDQSTYLYLASDADSSVRIALAQKSYRIADPAVVQALARDSDVDVRRALANYLRDDVVDLILAKDPDVEVRRAVGWGSDSTPVLAVLAEDTDSSIAETASERLAAVLERDLRWPGGDNH